jgi:RIO kinase 1
MEHYLTASRSSQAFAFSSTDSIDLIADGVVADYLHADDGEPRERPFRRGRRPGRRRSPDRFGLTPDDPARDDPDAADAGLDVAAPEDDASVQHRAFLRQVAHGRELFKVEADRPDDDPDATWSSYYNAAHGPEPVPDWVITDRAAVDHALGVLKTGKEADVHLVRRSLPGTERSVVLAAKRYRDTEHSQFHRDAAYLAGRRVRKSRDQRAMDNKTRTGREFLAGQWAVAEFGYLTRLWEVGAPVPYPVQLLGSELIMELITAPDGSAAPRLAQAQLTTAELEPLWDQLHEAMLVLAENGWAHGDLSEYNVLVAGDRLVLIDVPQVIDVISNPEGRIFLSRDVANVCRWFSRRGVDAADESLVTEELMRTAGLI